MMLTMSDEPGVDVFRLARGGLYLLASSLAFLLIARIVARYGPLYIRQDD